MALHCWTIGHSDLEIDRFVELLRLEAIEVVADVRSIPASQRYPRFNRAPFAAALREHGLRYVFLGDLLGGRPDEEGVYDPQGRVDYELVRTLPRFKAGIERLRTGLSQFRVAMVCAEEDPLSCHRLLLVVPALLECDVRVRHIRASGKVETQEEVERRLLDATKRAGKDTVGLFQNLFDESDRRVALFQAYREQARRKAYRKRGDDSSAR